MATPPAGFAGPPAGFAGPPAGFGGPLDALAEELARQEESRVGGLFALGRTHQAAPPVPPANGNGQSADPLARMAAEMAAPNPQPQTASAQSATPLYARSYETEGHARPAPMVDLDKALGDLVKRANTPEPTWLDSVGELAESLVGGAEPAPHDPASPIDIPPARKPPELPPINRKAMRWLDDRATKQMSEQRDATRRRKSRDGYATMSAISEDQFAAMKKRPGWFKRIGRQLATGVAGRLKGVENEALRLTEIDPLFSEIIEQEAQYRIEHGLYRDGEASVVRFDDWFRGLEPKMQRSMIRAGEFSKHAGGGWIDDARLKESIAGELNAGLPMYRPGATADQQKLYTFMKLAGPLAVPEAKGFFEKVARFGGDVGPLVAEITAAGRMLRGAGMARGASEPAAFGVVEGTHAALAGEDAQQAMMKGAGFGALLHGAKAGGQVVGQSVMGKAADPISKMTGRVYGGAAGEGALFGGSAALAGGDAQDIIIAGLLAPLAFNAGSILRHGARATFASRNSAAAGEFIGGGWKGQWEDLARSKSPVDRLVYKWHKLSMDAFAGKETSRAEFERTGGALSNIYNEILAGRGKYTTAEIARVLRLREHMREVMAERQRSEFQAKAERANQEAGRAPTQDDAGAVGGDPKRPGGVGDAAERGRVAGDEPIQPDTPVRRKPDSAEVHAAPPAGRPIPPAPRPGEAAVGRPHGAQGTADAVPGEQVTDGLEIEDLGLGIAGESPIPNRQSPIPNSDAPQDQIPPPPEDETTPVSKGGTQPADQGGIGRAGAGALRKMIKAAGFHPLHDDGNPDLDDLRSFFRRFYDAGREHEPMPTPERHPEDARRAYTAGMHDAPSRSEPTPTDQVAPPTEATDPNRTPVSGSAPQDAHATPATPDGYEPRAEEARNTRGLKRNDKVRLSGAVEDAPVYTVERIDGDRIFTSDGKGNEFETHIDNVELVEAGEPDRPIKKIGEKMAIGDGRGGSMDVLVEAVTRADGTDYELFKPADSFDKRGVLRIADVASGEVAAFTVYPSIGKARAEYLKAIEHLDAEPDGAETGVYENSTFDPETGNSVDIDTPPSLYDGLPEKTRNIFERLMSGLDADGLISVLYPANKVLRGEFTRRTGIKLDRTLSRMGAQVREWVKESEPDDWVTRPDAPESGTLQVEEPDHVPDRPTDAAPAQGGENLPGGAQEDARRPPSAPDGTALEDLSTGEAPTPEKPGASVPGDPPSTGAGGGAVAGQGGGGGTGPRSPAPGGAGSSVSRPGTGGGVPGRPGVSGGAGSGSGGGTPVAGSGGSGPAAAEPADEPADKPVAKPKPPKSQGPPTGGSDRDLVITDELAGDLFKASPKPRAVRNVRALEIRKALHDENRPPTDDERSALAKYTGWGGIQAIFDDYRADTPEWRDLYPKLKELLTDQEYASAMASVETAFFTPPAIVQSMYAAAVQMGIKGGKVLEPSMGIGHFFGLMPPTLRSRVSRYGVEMDDVSADMSSYLYPDSNIQHSKFEKAHLPDGFFDLVIGNPPFGDIPVYDKRYKRWATRMIHDYFWVRGMDLVRPGGLQMFVISAGTMDKPATTVREFLDAQGDLVAAFRLNNSALPGTKVTTDIIVMRKRLPDEKPAGESWMNVKKIPTSMWGDADLTDKQINEYYIAHPDHILGALYPFSQYFDQRTSKPGVLTSNTAVKKFENEGALDRLRELMIRVLPRNIVQQKPQTELTDPTQSEDFIGAPDDIPEGAYFLDPSGSLYRRGSAGQGQPWESEILGRETGGRQDLRRIKAATKVREATRNLLRAQYKKDVTDAELAALQKTLNEVYDRAIGAERTKAYPKGTPLNARTWKKALSDDPWTRNTITALEEWDELSRTATKGPLFTRRVGSIYERPTKAESPAVALAISMNETGTLDFDRMAELLGASPEQVTADLIEQELIYETPAGALVVKDEYLSGNVRKALANAEAAARFDRKFNRNVEALKKVQPVDLEPGEISVALGAPWVSEQAIVDFAHHLFDVEKNDYRPPIRVQHVPASAQWHVATDQRVKDSDASVGTWGLDDVDGSRTANPSDGMDGVTLLNLLLNQKQPLIKELIGRHPESNARIYRTHKKRTAAIRATAKRMRKLFEDWFWTDGKRVKEFVPLYNLRYNNMARRKFDGSHLTFPTMDPVKRKAMLSRPYQPDFVWRVMSGGNTLTDGAVGCGKTWMITAGAIEPKRMGICKKPLIVAYNAQYPQFLREAQQLYPGSRFLGLGANDFDVDKRQKALAQIAMNNKWDAIIMPHSVFKRISMSPPYLKQFFHEQLSEYREALAEARAAERDAGGQSNTVKQIENQIKKMEERLEKALNDAEKDTGLVWEELGIDWLMYDESHMAKKLMYYTQMDRVKGLDSPTGSQTAFDLWMKVQHINSVQNGRGVSFWTGTPVTNSIAEVWTIQRFLQMDKLREVDLHRLDAWVANFAEMTEATEATISGGYATTNRMRGFRNIPELMEMYYSFTQRLSTAELKKILAENGQSMGLPDIAPNSEGAADYETVILEPRTEMLAYMEKIGQRAAMVAKHVGPPVKGEDIILSVGTDMRHATLDPRSRLHGLPDRPGTTKAEAAAENVLSIWKDGENEKLTQLVFIGLTIPGTKKKKDSPHPDFSTYTAMKKTLIAGGMPADQIAFIGEAKTDAALERLYERMNDGDLRVLMGSIAKMGVGVNVQRKAIALHLLDPPWRPDEIAQAVGRIIRSGNTNPVVQLYRYITKAGGDEFMYQVVSNKARAIDQLFSDEFKDREWVDDSEDATSSFEMAQAMASNNPDLMKWKKAEQRLQDLQAAQDAHTNAVAVRAKKLHRLEEVIEGAEHTIEKQERVAALDPDPDGPDVFDMVDGTPIEKVTELGEWVLEHFGHPDARHKPGMPVMRYRGVNYYMLWLEGTKSTSEKMLVSADVDLYGTTDHVELSDNPRTIGMHARDSIKDIPAKIANNKSHLAKRAAELAALKAKDAPKFEQAEELAEAARREAELEQVVIAAGSERKHNTHINEVAAKWLASLEGVEAEYARAWSKYISGGAYQMNPDIGDFKGLTNDAAAKLIDDVWAKMRPEAEGEPGLPRSDAEARRVMSPAALQLSLAAQERVDKLAAAVGRPHTSPAGIAGRPGKPGKAFPVGLPPETRKWLDTHGPNAGPSFGMGAMYNYPELRGRWKKLWDVTADRLERLWETDSASARVVVKYMLRPFSGLKYGMTDAWWQGFRRVRGAMKWSKEKAGRINETLDAHLAAVEKEYGPGAPEQKSKQLYDVLNGNAAPGTLDATGLKIYDNYMRIINDLTDELLDHPELHRWMTDFGLENLIAVIEQRRRSGRPYVRRLYKYKKPRAMKQQASTESRLVGPRLRGGMFMFKRSSGSGDDAMWTVRRAAGTYVQFADQADAADFFDREIQENEKRYGESVYERVRMIDPFGEDVTLSLDPITDPRVLMAKTIVDLKHNVETLKLFDYLDRTVALHEPPENGPPVPGYVLLPVSRLLGPLSGAWVPEPVAHNLTAIEEVRTTFFPQLWMAYMGAWKSTHVAWSPSTWARNVFGMPYFWMLDGMNPITDLKWYKEAAREMKNGGAALDTLLSENRIGVGYYEADAASFESMTDGMPLFEALRQTAERMEAAGGLARRIGRAVVKGKRINRKVGRGYDFVDKVSVIASFLKKTKGEGLSPEQALERMWMYPNYDEVGEFARQARWKWWGQPFTSFADQSIKITLRGTRDRWGRQMGYFSIPGLMTLASMVMLGIDDEEMELINQDRQRKGFLDRWFQPILPWRDENGRPAILDLRWVMILGNDFNMTIKGKAIEIPFLFQQPGFKAIAEAVTGQDAWTGRDIIPEAELDDMSIAEAAWRHFSHAMEGLIPAPSVVTRGMKQAIEAAMGRDEREIHKIVLKYVFGINIKAPYVGRREAFNLLKKKGRAGDTEAFGDILKAYNVSYRRGKAKPIRRSSVALSVRRQRAKEAAAAR